MKRRGKIAIAIALVLGLGVGAGALWHLRQAELAGFAAAHIAPISGAENLINDYSRQSSMGGVAFWVYQLPPSYANELYKDCSRIGYKPGVFADKGIGVPDFEPYMKPGAHGCYMEWAESDVDNMAQFTGDKLLVEQIF